MAKLVRDSMTPGVQTVRTSHSAAEAAQFMRDNDVGSLPVLDNGARPIGMITDRDVAVRLVAEGKDPGATRVEEIFSRDIVTIESDRPLDEAEALMAQHKIRRLPVVEDGRLVGILAQADVALEESPEKAGQLLEQISEPTSTEREA